MAGVAFGALGDRFDDPTRLVLFGAWFCALVLLFATDLDQHLLPDLITLPLIPIAAIAAIAGLDPLVHDAFGVPGAIGIALALPLGLFLLSLPFGAGAIARGDLKLLVSVGLVSGLVRTMIGIVTGTLVVGAVIAVLLVSRRVSLKSFIPFGPIIVIGAMWSTLVRVG